MAKNILSNSLVAPKKEAKRELRRRIMAHGNTDADAIEEKRQHCSKQLIKMTELVQKLNRQRILMEQENEKKLTSMREGVQVNREKLLARNPKPTEDQIRSFDYQAESAIEEQALVMALTLNNFEMQIAQLSLQILAVESIGVLIDCVSCREVIEEDGKKTVVRQTVAALVNDVCYEMESMRAELQEAEAGEAVARQNAGAEGIRIERDEESGKKKLNGVKP